jgi:hypothetical protein
MLLMVLSSMPGCPKSKARHVGGLSDLVLSRGVGVWSFLCNNGLREAVVTDVVFVFEHFFYSSATGIL